MPKLIIKKENLLVKKLAIPENMLAFTVGSEQGNDIILQDEKISFFHLQFEKQNADYYVRDLHSQGGTYVNGRRIAARTEVKHNDEIALGHHKLTFMQTQLAAQPALTTRTSEGQYTTALNFGDRMAGIPRLSNLNSWLNNGDSSSEKQGGVLIEAALESTATISEFKSPAGGTTLNAIAHPQTNQTKPIAEFTNQKENHYVKPSLNFEIDALVQPPPTAPPKPVLEEIRPAIAPEATFISGPENHYLIGIYGYYLGSKFKIRRPECKIGRDRKQNHIVIKRNSRGKIDQSVSRRHATITFRNDQYFIRDKRSKSRTYVNQKMLATDEEMPLNPDDEIEVMSDGKSHILRMVAEGEWDFSFPKKAGVWHVRHRLKIVSVYSAILVVMCAFFFVKSFLTTMRITDKPQPLTAAEVEWYSEETNGNAAKSNAEFLCYPSIADLNGDQYVDLVYVNDQGYLQCIDGKGKSPLWTNNEVQIAPNLPINIADLNNDGRPDVIVATTDLRLRALDGNLGLEIWKSPILAGPLVAPPVVGDFNGDGLKDLAIASESNALYIGYSSLKNSSWTKIELDVPTRATASVNDFEGNGIPNILLGTENGKILLIDGNSEKITGEININEEISKASGNVSQSHQIRYPVALGDLDGDQNNDLIILTNQGSLLALNGVTLERFWYEMSDSLNSYSQNVNQSLALGDLDGDRLLDVIVVTPGGRLRAFKGMGQSKDRKMLLWEKPESVGEYFLEFPLLADFNKNGTADVFAANYQGQMYIFEGATGQALWKSSGSGHPITGVPLIGDLDRDHTLDVLNIKSDGKFYKLATNSVTIEHSVVWGQLFGGSEHPNRLTLRVQNVHRHYAYMAGSLLITSVIIGFNVIIRKKRRNLGRE